MQFLKLHARTRISLGLICLLMSVLSTAMLLGIIPETQTSIRNGRAHLCENIAWASSEYMSRGEIRRLDSMLESAVKRNPDLLSAGVRRASGSLMSEFGDHGNDWPDDETLRSTDTHIQVPIRKGQQRWGTVELCFRPIVDHSWWGTFTDPWMRMTIFVSILSFIAFQLYLKKMLSHLDPSKTVPKRVRNALDSLAEGLLVLDRQGRIVLANQSFSEWLDCPSEKLLGKDADQLGWDLSKVDVTPWNKAVRDEALVAGSMVELNLPDRPARMLIANASPVLGQQGKCRGVLVSFDDVTQLEETKRDLSIAKREADDANQAKSEFLARMSHEIRTPMNAILGYTDVLRRGFDTSNEDRQDYLNTIHGSGEHLLALINDILDLSKVESGQMELESGPCSPLRIIKDVVALLRSKADEKGIALEFRGEGKLPKEIQGDSVRLRQAIMNLAGNAIKFTDEGSVQVVARALDPKRSPHQQWSLAIDVIDTGIGISPEAQAKVFEPFQQADTSITRRFGGTGLGLAISKQLAEAMGGHISLASEVGKGTTFTIEIPLGQEQEFEWIDPVEAAAELESSSSIQKDVQQLPPCKILVADDGSPNRKLLQLVLGKAGAEVVAVENGQLAVEKATEQVYDIILMDMQMPVMDGYTATGTLRKAGYTAPIYALTANAMQGDQEKCLNAGCSGFLSKPIKIDLLLATIAGELGNPRRHSVDTQPSAGMDESIEKVTESVPAERQEASSDSSDIEYDFSQQTPIVCSYPLDDPEFLEIAQDFVDVLQDRLPKLKTLLDDQDWSTLAREAHWLKGVGGSAGFEDFVDPSKQLQLSAEAESQSRCEILVRQVLHLASRIDLVGSVTQSPSPPSSQSETNHESGSQGQAVASEPIESSLPMDDEAFREIVHEFLSIFRGKLDEMSIALATGDFVQLARLSHWLRGTGGSAGFDHFELPTRAMERLAGEEDLNGCRAVLQELHSISERIVVPAQS
ncbi:ATP-binding protein [Roseiconus lacunae]|uniref:ATP-binding protein n=1 Tax=Roseiconus lacunae TaxID=2605694 RepID=UPI0011F1FBF0|nr:ATP-binding protein [Roseiconus lacunae]